MKSANSVESDRRMPTPSIIYLMSNSEEPEEISVSFYENEIPSFIEAELVRLYSNLFSTLVQFKLYGKLENTRTYVERSSTAVRNVFLFNRVGRAVRVINEGIKVEQNAIRRFCHHVFTTYPAVNVVTFHAVQADIPMLSHPYQRINFLEDIVLTLPDSTEKYYNALGKSTRKTIKGYTNKFMRSFPTFRQTVFVNEEVEDGHIQEIIDFKAARMNKENKVSAFDREATQRIIRLVKECGMVCIATIDGRICAGSISYRVGENYFMQVSTHDPVYDEFRLGMIYCYLTICECIKRAGKECHFLWGRQEYKYRLLGVKRDLDNFLIYRSHLQFILNSDLAAVALLKGMKRWTALRLHAMKNQEGGDHKFALKIFGVRSILLRKKQDSATGKD